MSKRKRGKDNLPPLPPLPLDQDPRHWSNAMGQIGKQAYLKAEYSDLTIICGEVFHAHKLVVCPQSEYFKRACSGGFKESTGTIRLADTEPALVRKVLEYIYTGTYTLDFTPPDDSVKDRRYSLSSTDVKQSSLGPSSESGYIPSHLEPNVEQSSTTAAGSEPLGGTAGVEPLSPQSQVNSSDLGTRTAVAGPSGRASDLDFVATCIANPAYFHLRMYAEADYFMVRGLDEVAERAFYQEFIKSPKKETLEETITELYSNRADYDFVRMIAVRILQWHLKNRQIDNASILDYEFMNSIPQFTLDLCMRLVTDVDSHVAKPKDSIRNHHR